MYFSIGVLLGVRLCYSFLFYMYSLGFLDACCFGFSFILASVRGLFRLLAVSCLCHILSPSVLVIRTTVRYCLLNMHQTSQITTLQFSVPVSDSA